MSYEIVTEDGNQGQFASNRGYADLIRATAADAVLSDLFDKGESEDVEGVIAALKRVTSPSDVADTARGLIELIQGAKEILITDGLTGGDSVGKDDEDNRLELSGEIVKVDQSRHLVFGWFSVISINGRIVTDTQGDQIQSEDLEETAYRFVLDSRRAGTLHERVEGIGRLVESCLFTAEKQSAMVDSLKTQGIDATISIPAVCWWGGFRIDDENTWQRIQTGELCAWSIGGTGVRQKIA